ncbi:phage major capsid protein [Vibrio owensii]|uniref:phage major capsid protein n=1 Tax=Vibrio owensii TaxID=696485 RepID=UPI0038CDD450
MPVPIVPGQAPNYSAGSTSEFVPEVWSGKLVVKFYDTTVLAAIANTDYEGEIKNKGDKVYIRTRASITVSDYQKGMTLTYEHPESPSTELLIDKAKYFAFELKEVDRVQSDLNLMNEWADDASEQMKITIDTDVLSVVFSQVVPENAGATAGRISIDINLGVAGTPLEVDKENILDVIVDCGTVLDEQNVPETGRYIILPARICGMIKKSDLRDASLAGDGTSILRNGRLGMIDRFTVYCSNLLNVTDGEYDVIFGHKVALTFASQITEMEELKNPNDFGTFTRGLQVYGYKVIKPEAMGHAVLKKAPAAAAA